MNELTADKMQRRDDIKTLETVMRKHPEAIIGDSPLMPLKHTFGDGIYVRDLTIPKDTIIIGKIHKYRTLNILLKGDITILTEDGIKRLKAPQYFIAPPGNKKVGYTHEETVWINVLATEETDLEKIEEHFILENHPNIIDIDANLLIERMKKETI